jgi:hypothetical protein
VLGQGSATDLKRLHVRCMDELAGMRGIKHRH